MHKFYIFAVLQFFISTSCKMCKIFVSIGRIHAFTKNMSKNSFSSHFEEIQLKQHFSLTHSVRRKMHYLGTNVQRQNVRKNNQSLNSFASQRHFIQLIATWLVANEIYNHSKRNSLLKQNYRKFKSANNFSIRKFASDTLICLWTSNFS